MRLILTTLLISFVVTILFRMLIRVAIEFNARLSGKINTQHHLQRHVYIHIWQQCPVKGCANILLLTLQFLEQNVRTNDTDATCLIPNLFNETWPILLCYLLPVEIIQSVRPQLWSVPSFHEPSPQEHLFFNPSERPRGDNIHKPSQYYSHFEFGKMRMPVIYGFCYRNKTCQTF